MKVLLTDKAIRNAVLKKKPYKLFDGGGLYLLVKPSGSKLWRMKYYYGKEKTLSFGNYPIVTLAEARDKRHDAKKLLNNNIDPNKKKREERRANLFDTNNTFAAVMKDWHRVNESDWVPKHAQKTLRRLELHVLPLLGNIPIAQIRTPELVRILRKVETQRKLETGARLIHSMNAIFRHGIQCGILERNPAADLGGVITSPQATHFAAIRPSELPHLLASLETVDANIQTRIAVKLLLHVFLRPGELRYGKWAEIDFDGKQWTIPPERMKKRRPHVVPLSSQAIGLLQELKAITGYSEYLFPSQQRRRHPVMSENTINKVLVNMGYKGKQVGHGFRAIASTTLNESGLFRSDVIEMQLAHVENNDSRKPYNRAEYIEERTEMMQWWGNYIEAAGKR